MTSCLVRVSQPYRVAFVLVLTLLLPAWTCNFGFQSCLAGVQQPHISSLSPDNIPGDATSVLLTVNGSDFIPQSQILWNRNRLQTTYIDSGHLQATITQQTFESFGGSAGNNVLISVESRSSFECSDEVSSTLVLVIN
jgi:hypothetical protein